MKRTEIRRSWLDDDANLRAWHEAGWWARLWFRVAVWATRRSPTTRSMVIRAAQWHSPDARIQRLAKEWPSPST